MTWLIIAGGLALIGFALWAMMQGGGSGQPDSDAQQRDVANAIDLTISD